MADNSLSEGIRALRMHAGWAMVILGFAPFTWQVVLGTWDAAQLGSWVSFCPIGPWGALAVYANTHTDALRSAGIFTSLVHLVICLCALRSLIFIGLQATRSNEPERVEDAFGSPHSSVHGASAYAIALIGFLLATIGINGVGGMWVLIPTLFGDTPTHVLVKRVLSTSTLVSGMCGSLLGLAGLSFAFSHEEPLTALQHPNAFGVSTTAMSWIIYACFSKKIFYFSKSRWQTKLRVYSAARSVDVNHGQASRSVRAV